MTAFLIKMIALITMLIDHAGEVFDLPSVTRLIGRIAFPLFVYLIAEGCRHSKSMEKYILRLGIFAVISELAFDLAFEKGINFFYDTNIFYTLFLGVACVYALQMLEKTGVRFISVLAIVPLFVAMWIAEFVASDYGSVGVLFIFCTALAGRVSKVMQVCVLAVFCVLLYLGWPSMLGFSLISVPIVAFANGQKGRDAKWLFYIAYPGHLLLYWLVALIFM